MNSRQTADLQIAMNDAMTMRLVERIGDLGGDGVSMMRYGPRFVPIIDRLARQRQVDSVEGVSR